MNAGGVRAVDVTAPILAVAEHCNSVDLHVDAFRHIDVDVPERRENGHGGPPAVDRDLAQLGVLMKDQPPAVVDRIRSEYDRLAADYRSADGMLALPAAALLASGTVQ